MSSDLIKLCNIESEISNSLCSFSLLVVPLRSAFSTEIVCEILRQAYELHYVVEQEFVKIFLKTNFSLCHYNYHLHGIHVKKEQFVPDLFEP